MPLPTSARLRSHVPQEIIDLILDEVAAMDEQSARIRTLANCTLSCSALLPRASRHLLRRIEVTAGDQLLRLLHSASRSTRLSAYVRELVFHVSCAEDLRLLLRAKGGPLEVLPSLRLLKIHNDTWIESAEVRDYLCPSGLGHGLQDRTSFRGHLHLCGNAEVNFVMLSHTFTHVDTLTIDDGLPTRYPALLQICAVHWERPTISVASLVLCGARANSSLTVGVLDKFLAHLSAVSLLDFVPDTEELNAVYNFLCRAGKRLEYMCFRPHGRHSGQETDWNARE